MLGRFIPFNKFGLAAFIVIFGIMGAIIVLQCRYSSPGMAQLGPDDCEKAAWATACSWGQAAGLNLERIVFLDFEPNYRRLYSTVEYLDPKTSLFRRVFFDLEYSEDSGWKRRCFRDFSSLPNFSAPLISPQSIIQYAPEFLDAYSATFLINIKAPFCYLFGRIRNRCTDAICASDHR
jgi:hypothetical protein